MKVAIVARAPSTRYTAPFSDPDWQIWTLSPMGAEDNFCDLPRFDRWYEIHQLDEKEVECPGYLEWLETHGDKVWIREPHIALPEAQVYPIKEVCAYFQTFFTNRFSYYNNSVSLMIAHAIWDEMLQVTDIMLAGVDMCQTSEYGSQKPSCELFIGLAAGHKMKLHIPEGCDMLKTTRIYGIEDPSAWDIKSTVHRTELEGRLKTFQDQLNESQQQLVGAASAHGELTDVLAQLNGDPTMQPVKEIIQKRLGQLQEIGEHHRSVTQDLDGKIKTNIGAQEELRYMQQFMA